jgi:type IV pilus assembly protein PilM
MNVFGLDIGSTSIKIAQVAKQDKKFRLVSAGMMPTPLPGINSEQENDLITLATAIKKLHQDAKISTKDVVISLPEEAIFTRVVELPPMNDAELAQAIPWEAEQFVPMPIGEVTLDWLIVSKGATGKIGDKMKVLLVAAPTAIVKKHTKVMEMCGFNLVAIDTELMALTRALLNPASPVSLLINFGAKACDMAIVINGQIQTTRTLSTAGDALTRAISSTLSLDISQAEEYKKAYGLNDTQLEGKIKQSLTPVFDMITTEIKKTLLSWREKDSQPVKGIIMSGGTALMPGMTTYLTQQLGVEVQVADPFSQLIVDPNFMAGLKQNAPVFSLALGLAEKEV